jgi:integrase
VTLYKGSDDFQRLSDTTKAEWAKWLDRIAEYFGDLSTRQFDRPEKIRPIIRNWRNQWSDKPRTADYGMQVLSRVLSFAVDPLSRIASNPCEGIKQLYSGNRSEIIWTDADIDQLKAGGPEKPLLPEIAFAVDLAAHTGLRLSDLLRLSWSHIKDDAIVLPTGKSRGRREAIIPLYDELRSILDRIPKRSTTVLTSSKARPWTPDGFGSSFNTAKKNAKIGDLHFHDLRGTAATKFYIAGLSIRVIAEIMAWDEESVKKIIHRYVGRQAATKAMIEQLNEARRRTKSAKPSAKP